MAPEWGTSLNALLLMGSIRLGWRTGNSVAHGSERSRGLLKKTHSAE